jgi:hypothetical protein
MVTNDITLPPNIILHEGEKIIWLTKFHKARIIFSFIGTAIMLLVALLMTLIPPIEGQKVFGLHFVLVIIGISLFRLIMTISSVKQSSFVITNKRFIANFTTIIGKGIKEMELGKIENIDLGISNLGERFGYGTLEVVGTGGDKIILQNIEKPETTKIELSGAKKQLEGNS